MEYVLCTTIFLKYCILQKNFGKWWQMESVVCATIFLKYCILQKNCYANDGVCIFRQTMESVFCATNFQKYCILRNHLWLCYFTLFSFKWSVFSDEKAIYSTILRWKGITSDIFYFPPEAGKYINRVVRPSVCQFVPKNYEGSQRLCVGFFWQSVFFATIYDLSSENDYVWEKPDT